MLVMHPNQGINLSLKPVALANAARHKNHNIRQFVRKWKSGKPTANISNSGPLTLKEPRLLYAESLPRELSDLKNYPHKTFLDGYDLTHGNTYGSAHFFNFTFLADSARQNNRVDTVFRLHNFRHPDTNAHGLYLKLAYALADRETYDEVGSDRLQDLLKSFIAEPVEFTQHYRADETQTPQQISPSSSHQWFMFDYVSPDPLQQFTLEEESLRRVLRWLLDVGALQTIPGPPPNQKPLYRLKQDIPEHWQVGYLDSLGKRAQNFPLFDQIDLCSRHSVYFEYSRFTFGDAKLWCEKCFKLRPVPRRYATSVCLDTSYAEDPRLAMLEDSDALQPFHCMECNPPGRGKTI